VSRRADLFAAIEHVARDPDPSPSRCADAAPNDPHLTVALNSIRGRALALAVDHLVWLRHAGAFQSIADCPEVEALITERLAAEESPAVLSVPGRHFKKITALDAGWAAAIKEPLFNGRHSPDGRDDAWCAYLAENSTAKACSLVMDVYERHVVQLDPAAEVSGCDRGLVQHLVALHWSGKIDDIGVGDTIIEKLFSSAPPELKGYAIEHIGRSLAQSGDSVEEGASKRLRALWNWRRGVAEANSVAINFVNELQAFQWWFTADNLDTNWLLDNVEWTLQNGATHQHPYQLAKHLAVIANRAPLSLPAVLRCYEHLIAPGDVPLLGWEGELYEVTATSIATENTNLRTQASHLANKLVSRGYFKFRDLLH
jgi:hypothetical protein